MQTFKVNRNIEIVCESKNRRSGFKHVATLLVGGIERDEAKCLYVNRTWERWEYQSVLQKLADETRALSSGQIKTLKRFIKNDARAEDALKPLKHIAMIASLGDVFGKPF